MSDPQELEFLSSNQGHNGGNGYGTLHVYQTLSSHPLRNMSSNKMQYMYVSSCAVMYSVLDKFEIMG